jgi:Holliday junction resolvase RusA-like endonuclease
MSTLLSIFIPGKVSGKGRARFARVGNFVRTYTPEKTANAEGIIRTMVAIELRGRPPSDMPIWLEVHVSIAPPTSWPQWKREAALAGRIDPTCKPDLDNVVKLVKDALNKVAWDDDAQVVICDAGKAYGEAEGLRIVVHERPFMTAQNARREQVAKAA